MGGEGIVGFITATVATTDLVNLTWFRLIGAMALIVITVGVLLKKKQR
jgi:hypothetical protein